MFFSAFDGAAQKFFEVKIFLFSYSLNIFTPILQISYNSNNNWAFYDKKMSSDRSGNPAK